jgi:LacI family transcriptional regulator
MKDLNYHPSALARNLSRSQMNVIGLVFNEGVYVFREIDTYFAPTLNAISATANELKQSLLLCSDDLWSNVPDSFSQLLDKRCDGLLLFALRRDNPLPPVLVKSDVPFLMVGDTHDDPAIGCVDVDNLEVGRLAARYLIERGHRNIGFVPIFAGYRCYPWSEMRFEGYKLALMEAGIPFREELVGPPGISAERHLERFEYFLRLPPDSRPTALFCLDDETAFECMIYMQGRGIKAPDDISFIGVNDFSNRPPISPGLTSIAQPLQQIGRLSLETVHKMVRGTIPRNHREILPVKITERESVRVLNLT